MWAIRFYSFKFGWHDEETFDVRDTREQAEAMAHRLNLHATRTSDVACGVYVAVPRPVVS